MTWHDDGIRILYLLYLLISLIFQLSISIFVIKQFTFIKLCVISISNAFELSSSSIDCHFCSLLYFFGLKKFFIWGKKITPMKLHNMHLQFFKTLVYFSQNFIIVYKRKINYLSIIFLSLDLNKITCYLLKIITHTSFPYLSLISSTDANIANNLQLSFAREKIP